MPLPPPNPAQEDAFLDALRQAEHEEVLAAVEEAMRAGRPQLAARIVGLLPRSMAADQPAVARARKAARMFLMASLDRRGPIIAELEAAVADLKADWVQRARARQRAQVKDPHQREASPARRKPRLTGRKS